MSYDRTYKQRFFFNVTIQMLITPSFLKISKFSNKPMKAEIVTFDTLLKNKCNIFKFTNLSIFQ